MTVPKCFHRDRNERKRQQRNQGQAHIDGQHEEHADNERQRGGGRVHHGGADHHSHGTQVVSGTRHQVARAVMLEVRIETLEVGEEIVAEVMLDVARCADDDPAHQEAEYSADGRKQEDRAAIETHLRRVDTARQIVDGELQDPRTCQSDRCGADDADQPGKERTAITKHVCEQLAARGHLLSIWCAS